MAKVTTNKNSIKSQMQKLREKFDQSQNNSGGFTVDENVIFMETGKTYSVRLINVSYDDEQVIGPFIEKWMHWVPMSDEEKATKIPIVCPRTDIDKQWWKKCDFCQYTNELYNSNDDNRFNIYNKKFQGFVPVYVVKDPTNSENEGHVKMLRYIKDTRDFLLRNIFNSFNDKPEDDVVGDEAFNFPEGYNLNIVVSTNERGYRQYEPSFSRKKTKIDVDMEVLQQEIETIDPESYIEHYNEEKIKSVYKKFVLGYQEDDDSNGSSEELSEIDNSGTEAEDNSVNAELSPVEGNDENSESSSKQDEKKTSSEDSDDNKSESSGDENKDDDDDELSDEDIEKLLKETE